MKKHLAIFKGQAGEEILSGKKTIESRFSKVKKAPFGVVSSGDMVYIKPSGKEIIGEFRVKKVCYFEDPEIKTARYATFIFIGDSARFITSPLKFKKKDSRGWVVLEQPAQKR